MATKKVNLSNQVFLSLTIQWLVFPLDAECMILDTDTLLSENWGDCCCDHWGCWETAMTAGEVGGLLEK